ncbi:hypothetical protein V565_123430 [Rhizoctonia solani 123E]|uniref:Uncharacterized protein n=1 Tax=Rhizoctonia solani 123E TaxID=1423351 RepID=A0A074RNN5_9AGAM|nr:hypothetical protein V565_123430 [Rhizoctonia solani 123E]
MRPSTSSPLSSAQLATFQLVSSWYDTQDIEWLISLATHIYTNSFHPVLVISARPGGHYLFNPPINLHQLTMGRISPPTHHRPSLKPRVALTVLSAIATFLPFVGLPMTSLSSVFGGLIEGVQQIVGITRKSRRQELVDFGEYVDSMVSQLVSALRNDQVVQDDTVIRNLEELQKVLDSISRQISRNHSGGWLSRIRRLLFPDESDILRMRRQLDDALRLFQLAASIRLLLETPRVSASVAVPDAPNQPQALNPSDSTSIPVHHHPRAHGSQVEQARGTPQLSPQSEYPTPPHTQPATPRRPPVVVARSSDLEAGKITAAFMNVKSRRHSFQYSRTPIKKMELAIALGHLSILLAQAGRALEALEASQESAEIFRTIAEMEH